MADIICVVGNKGGTGKTALTHMLGHGLSLLGHAPVWVFTDTQRDPIDPAGRRYACCHMNNLDDMAAGINSLRRREAGLGVVDGGSSLNAAGPMLYDLADLVIIPFRDSSEDIRSVLRDLRAFPRAYLLPCQWPTNPWQQRGANRLLEEFLGHHSGRILKPVFAHSATKLLLQEQMPSDIPSMLNNACRDIARQVVGLLNIRLRTDTSRSSSMAPGNKRLLATA